MTKHRGRWIVRLVWVLDDDGTELRGTLYSSHGGSVKIRIEDVPGVAVLPVASRGTRWDFLESQDRAPDR